VLADERRRFFGRVHHREKLQIRLADEALCQQGGAKPVHQSLPEFGAEKHDGKRSDALGLNEHQRLGQFVQRAVAAGHGHVGRGIFDEHELANEEVAVVAADRQVFVRLLFQGQVDVQTDRGALGLQGALVGRFHESRAAAGDDRKARLDEEVGQLGRVFVERVFRLGAGRTENGHGRADVPEFLEAVHDFGHDLKKPPGFGHGQVVDEVLARGAHGCSLGCGLFREGAMAYMAGSPTFSAGRILPVSPTDRKTGPTPRVGQPSEAA